MDDHDALIDSLSRTAGPVKRPLAPAVRAGLWIAAALPAGALAAIGLGRVFAAWSAPAAIWSAVELVSAFVIGSLAILSAFNLTIAGRKPVSWPWFAVAAVAWLSAGLTSVAHGAEPWGHAGSGSGCYLFMVTAGLPMISLAILSLNRTRTLYPLRCLAIAGLGIAGMTATLLALCHPPTGDLPDLIMHLVAAVTIIGVTVGLGRHWVAIR